MKIKQYLIAIVDDDQDDRDILAASFRENHDNAAVVTFEDGITFLEYLKAGNLPDLIVTDLYMPRFSGLELILEVRKDKRFKRIPIVLLSTIKNEVVLTEVVEIVGVYYFVKPVGLLDYVLLSEKIMDMVLPRQ